MTSTALSDTMAALLRTVESFWPEAEVRLGRGRPCGDVVLPVIPGLARPRMLLPSGRREATASLLRFSAALGAREAAVRTATAAVAATLGPGVLGADHVSVRGGGDSLATHLAGLLGHEVSFSITIGNARANRKPVLQVFDPAGRTVGFAKVGDTAVARGHVHGEAEALRVVEGRLGGGFEVPRVLSVGEWGDMLVLLITPLGTRPQDPRRAGRIPLAAMTAFSAAFDGGRAELASVPWWAHLRSTVAGLTDGPLAASLHAGLARVERAAGSAEFDLGAWHGDWTGWNMASRGGTLQLWDFERFETGVVRGLDPFHYAVNAAVRDRGFTTGVVLDGAGAALRQLGDAGLVGDRQRLVAAVYLAAIGTRSARYAEQEGGEVVASRARVTAEALQAWLL